MGYPDYPFTSSMRSLPWASCTMDKKVSSSVRYPNGSGGLTCFIFWSFLLNFGEKSWQFYYLVYNVKRNWILFLNCCCIYYMRINCEWLINNIYCLKFYRFNNGINRIKCFIPRIESFEVDSEGLVMIDDEIVTNRTVLYNKSNDLCREIKPLPRLHQTVFKNQSRSHKPT